MMNDIIVKFIKGSSLAISPKYAHEIGDSGCDAYSIEDAVIPPKDSRIIDTGVIVEIPLGYEIQVRSRSGLSAKNKVFVLNSPGTIDSNFRNTIKIILMNLGEVPFKVNIGDRIAQLVLQRVPKIIWEEVSELTPSDRGEKGFGSTGV